MKISHLGFVSLFVLSTGSAAWAQGKKEKNPPPAAAPKTKEYSFEGENLSGELIKPDSDMIDPRKFAKQSSLIRIRKDFIREIVKTAEDR